MANSHRSGNIPLHFFAVVFLTALLFCATALPTNADEAVVDSPDFGSFLGSTNQDAIKGATRTSDGGIVVVGRTTSPDFPTSDGALDRSCNTTSTCGGAGARGDAFVAKFSADGTSLIFSTFLGGDGDDGAAAVVEANDGTLVIVGYTESGDFPTTPGAFDTTLAGGPGLNPDGFVVRLRADGSRILFGTYLGGTNRDSLFDLDLNSSGDIVVVGHTFSDDFPTTAGVFDSSFGGGADGIVARLSANGAQLIFSGFLGGDSQDVVLSVDVDPFGTIFAVGETSSADFPTTPGVIRSSLGGTRDGFVTRLDQLGANALFSTYFGGVSGDSVLDVQVDAQGRSYLVGSTFSTDFPISPGAFDPTKANADDAFFSILNAAGTGIDYGTFMSISQTPRFNGVSVDLLPDGTAILGATWTETLQFSDRTPYYVRIDPRGKGANDMIFDCRLCFRFNRGILHKILYDNGSLVLVGETSDDKFPVTQGAFDSSFGGAFDGFIIERTLPPTSDVDLRLSVRGTGAVSPGEEVEFLIEVLNRGAKTATSTTISTTLGAASYISDTSGIAPATDGATLSWSVGSIALNQSVAFRLRLKVPQTELGTLLTIPFDVASNDPEANPDDNSVTQTLFVGVSVYLPILVSPNPALPRSSHLSSRAEKDADSWKF